MLSIFLKQSGSAADGYHITNLLPGLPEQIDLQDQFVLVMLKEPQFSNINYTISHGNNIIQMNSGKYTFISLYGDNVKIINNLNVGVEVKYWIVPRNICPSVSYQILSDYNINVFLDLKEKLPDFCVFPYYTEEPTATKFIFPKPIENEVVEFYQDKGHLAKKCTGNKQCQYKQIEFEKAFYIKVKPLQDQTFQTHLSYTVDRWTLDTRECQFKAIPYVNAEIDNLVHVPSNNAFESDIQCLGLAQSKSNRIRFAFQIIGVGIFVIVIVIAILHFANVINICSLSGKTENEHFEDLREEKFIPTIDIEADAEQVPELTKEEKDAIIYEQTKDGEEVVFKDEEL